jgi:hypothetical protein
MPLVRGAVFLLLLFVVLPAFAQESVTQQTNAPSVKWYQLNTPNFKVLYPKGFDIQAQRVANTLETIREPEGKSMGAVPKKIPVILQSNSSLSNGFVTLAPRRSEFYTMPSQNYNFVGNNDWLSLLSSHEYRHMAQFQRSITGFNKLIYTLFGQQALAGFAFAAAPQWFWEGDAVATETAFTHGGRGRIPNFDLVFRTNLQEGRVFNYHKQYLRSYKHNIPNHYVLGYNMVSYLRRKTNDPMIWEKVAGRSWNVPFIPFAFSNALKKETGLYLKDLYAEMASERIKDYEAAIRDLKFTDFTQITKRKSAAYTDYFYPQPLDNGRVLVTKSGIGDIETLVVLSPDGNQEEKYVQGIINDAGMLSATEHGRVVWNEFRYDPRWLVRNYSVIKGFDFETRTAKVISHNSRYSAAAISPDGRFVATVETTEEYKVQLVVLNYESGAVVATLANPNNDFISMPRWTGDGKSVVALRSNTQGKTLTQFDVAAGTSRDLLPFSDENKGYPVPVGDFILFNSPSGGLDNIYALNAVTGERFQVTISKYGAYNPSVSSDGKTLYYNEQSRDGMNVVKTSFDPSRWMKQTEAPVPVKPLYEPLVEQESNPDLLKNISNTTFTSRRYHRASGMINPHSWGPYVVNSLTRINVGITSQDILSTTSIDGGYSYDLNERTGQWRAAVSYQGFFPILDVSATMGSRSFNEGDVRKTVVQGSTVNTSTRNLTVNWDEQTVEGGVRIPLVTTTSKYYGNVEIGNAVGITHVTDFTNTYDNSGNRIVVTATKNDSIRGVYSLQDYVGNGNLVYNHFSLNASRLMKVSRRDIYSRWGQVISIDAFNTPYGGDFAGNQFTAYATMYFPGLAKHHSFWGWWGYQNTQISQITVSSGGKTLVYSNEYFFRNQLPLPRGQSVARYQNFYSMSANYTLPLWYPDIAIGPLLNLQRLRANLFADYGYGRSVFKENTFSQSYTTVGGELRVDLNVMRFLPQFNVGVRYSYGITPAVTRFEVLIGAFNF